MVTTRKIMALLLLAANCAALIMATKIYEEAPVIGMALALASAFGIMLSARAFLRGSIREDSDDE